MRFKSFFVLIISIFVVCVLVLSGHLSFIIVVSDSMEPSVPRGSFALVVRTNDYGVGDVILFKVYSKPVLHRIVDVENGYYRTKGDRNTLRDPWRVAFEAVGGELVIAVPNLGYIFWILRKPLNFALSITLIFVIMELRAQWQAARFL